MTKKKIKILLESGLINISALARELFPNNKTATNHLNQKIKGIAGRQLTDSDYQGIKDTLKKYL